MTQTSFVFKFLLLTSFLIRIVILTSAFAFPLNMDAIRYKVWTDDVLRYGIKTAYEKHYADPLDIHIINQPPGSLYILTSMSVLGGFIAKQYIPSANGSTQPQLIYEFAQILFLRFPSIVADLCLAILVYSFVKREASEKQAVVASTLLLFNPVIIYNSSFWGQMDSINTLFFYLALFMLYRKNYYFSVLALAISLSIKLSLLYFLPFFLFYLYINMQSSKRFLKVVLIGIIPIYLLTLPISVNPFWFIKFIYTHASGELQHITVAAFNFWWLIFKPHLYIHTTTVGNHNLYIQFSPLSSEVFLGLTLSAWGIVLFLIFSLPLFRLMLKAKKMSLSTYVFLCCIHVLLAFTFLPRMHERYLYLLFPLLACYIGLTGRFLKTFFILSLFHFLNLWTVWHPIPAPTWFITFFMNRTTQWFISLTYMSTATFLYFQALYSFFDIQIVQRQIGKWYTKKT